MVLKKAQKTSYLVSNLEHLLNEFQLDIKNLAAATGVPAPTLARIKRQGANPTISTLEPLLEFFRIDLDSLLYEDITSKEYQNKKRSGLLTHIPVIALEDVDKKDPIINQFVGSAGITNPDVFGVQIKSQALNPIFPNNCIVIIDPHTPPQEGDYVLCQLNQDKEWVFRQLFKDGNQCFFKPLNPDFGQMQSYKTFEILGVIIKSIDNFR